MKTILLTLLLILPAWQDAIAGDGHRKPRSQRRPVRNFIWFHPNRAPIINGIAVGPFDFQSFRGSNLTVNCLNLELPGVQFSPCLSTKASLP